MPRNPPYSASILSVTNPLTSGTLRINHFRMPLIGQVDFKQPILSLGKLPRLEYFYWHAHVLFSPNIRFISPKNERFPRIPRLKVFDYKIAAKNSWYLGNKLIH